MAAPGVADSHLVTPGTAAAGPHAGDPGGCSDRGHNAPPADPNSNQTRRARAPGPFGGGEFGSSGALAGAGGRVCRGAGAQAARGRGPVGGGGALELSVGCRRGAGPSWQREVPGSWPQNAREPQEPNFWAEVVPAAEGSLSVLGMAGWAGSFHESGPAMALPLPRPGFVLKPRGGKAGPLARPVEPEERGTSVDGA